MNMSGERMITDNRGFISAEEVFMLVLFCTQTLLRQSALWSYGRIIFYEHSRLVNFSPRNAIYSSSWKSKHESGVLWEHCRTLVTKFGDLRLAKWSIHKTILKQVDNHGFTNRIESFRDIIMCLECEVKCTMQANSCWILPLPSVKTVSVSGVVICTITLLWSEMKDCIL